MSMLFFLRRLLGLLEAKLARPSRLTLSSDLYLASRIYVYAVPVKSRVQISGLESFTAWAETT